MTNSQTRYYHLCGRSREPGELLLQSMFSWAPDDDAALEGARPWKGAKPKEYYREDWSDPQAMYEHAERTISDDELRELIFLSSEEWGPQDLVAQAVKAQEAGFEGLRISDHYCRIYDLLDRDEVLPRLR
jgi:hypothetical protein